MQVFLTKDNDRLELDLGPLAALADTTCLGHSPLLNAYRNAMLPLSYDDLPIRLSAKIKPGAVSLCPQGIPLPDLTWELVLVNKESDPDHIGTGCILNADWVDIGLINQWRGRCRTLHGPKCGHAIQQVPLPTGPAWLIDLDNKCLVSGSAGKRFVALSYTLGRYPGFIMNSEKLVLLQQPHAISEPEFWGNIPPTIRHAMALASVIGERYLWTDVLCIVHGDVAATAAQLKLMSAIYANAVLTVVAADEDAQEGLLGLENISTSRNINQPVLPFGSKERIAVRDTNPLIYPVYHSRGWTYQEYLMSPRKVLFFEKQLHWECEHAIWHEDQTPGTNISQSFLPHPAPRLQVILAGFPELGSLERVISSYNTRNLAYDQDALPALTGLLSVFTRSFTGAFLYGLPEMFFDRALGWHPAWKGAGSRRRTPRTLPNATSTTSALPESSLPSWSWIGWQGEVSWPAREASRIDDNAGWPLAETFPITEWYTSRTPSGSPMRRVRSTWFENRDAIKDHTRPLPLGWTRHEGHAYTLTNTRTKGVEYNYPEGCGRYHYKHRKLTYKESSGQNSNLLDSWFHPIPVADMRSSPPAAFTMPEQTPYLFCTTKRSFLWARRDRKYGSLYIVNRSGQRIGALQLQLKKETREIPAFPPEAEGVSETHMHAERNTLGRRDELGRRIELVAINRQKMYVLAYDKERDMYLDPPRVYETYTVLWVEWEEGVAYRRGIGSVESRAWEEQDLEDVSLVLG
ncbi:uncharacterized protein DSM5745_06901 [Aspergillus mulundensis]|uniref:Heterokaryon incompatibility domain-containing protein n=1 Tax=Aspergillus mulundensis TaxID=1810919 RepID=A0A3D8RJM0_9EURO|nr:hypothetical protein DSM5745_06901 [Aspergillus mulundensis]RDW74239.1 hypothetical protein DSM5745_06901 [Aspergillus mulundensis]